VVSVGPGTDPPSGHERELRVRQDPHRIRRHGFGDAVHAAPDPLRSAVVVLVSECVAEGFHRVAATDAVAHEVDEVVDLAQFECAVTA
jgi:hypothetical protein